MKDEKTYRIAFFTVDWNYELVESTLHGLKQYTDDHPNVYISVFDCFGKNLDNAKDKSEYAIFNLADLSQFDGLLIPGGEDIDPARYGQENTGCRTIDPVMDELQFHALDIFVKAGKPVLGICNGMQMINIYFGGDLIQDIPSKQRHQRNAGKDSWHGAAPDSWFSHLAVEVAGEETGTEWLEAVSDADYGKLQ